MSSYVVVDDDFNIVVDPFPSGFQRWIDGRLLTWYSEEAYMKERELRGAEDAVWSVVEGEQWEDMSADQLLPYNDRLRECGETITELVVEKNEAYGDAIHKVHEILKVLYPNGILPSQYGDALLLVRDLDKTCRIAAGDAKAFGENPWQDKAGYGICGMAT